MEIVCPPGTRLGGSGTGTCLRNLHARSADHQHNNRSSYGGWCPPYGCLIFLILCLPTCSRLSSVIQLECPEPGMGRSAVHTVRLSPRPMVEYETRLHPKRFYRLTSYLEQLQIRSGTAPASSRSRSGGPRPPSPRPPAAPSRPTSTLRPSLLKPTLWTLETRPRTRWPPRRLLLPSATAS
mgnify:CR=1 FL=1